MDYYNLRVIFSLANMGLILFGFVAILMMMPNETQTRITKENKIGIGMFLLGLLTGYMSVVTAQGAFVMMIGNLDVSGFASMIIASFAGFLIGWGGIIALPDWITDPILDTKNVKWLAVFVIVLIVIASIILG